MYFFQSSPYYYRKLFICSDGSTIEHETLPETIILVPS